MYCRTCGKELQDSAFFCPGCGCMVENAKKSPAETKRKQEAYISIIFGVNGICFAWTFALIGHISSIIGIIFGIKECKETNGKTGLALSIVGEVCSIISSVIGAAIMSSLF